MRPILLAACALGACSIQPADEDVAANAAANAVTAAPATSLPIEPPLPGNTVSNATAPVIATPIPAPAPVIDETAQGAANVVQRYYALIADKKYAEAWALWENVGQASGLSAQAFAASFDKYSQYSAQVGAPGAIDSGAGQRYVTVPVQIIGKLKTGALVNMAGSVTLHRAAVDGASLEQKSWRIRTADIKPRPDAAATPLPAVDNRSRLTYKCIDGSRIAARFDPDNMRVTLVRGGRTLMLRQERMASGIRYAAGGTSFAGKGDNMTFSQPNQPPLPCSPLRR